MHSIPQSPKSSTSKIPIFAGGRVIGTVSGGVFYKVISFSKHALRTPPGIAFDVSTLDDAENAGADRVDILDKETGKHYLASLALVRSAGFSLNRGFGSQWALTLSYFSVDGKPPRNAPAKPKKTEPGVMQLSFLGGAK
jgi:hypothetical protein